MYRNIAFDKLGGLYVYQDTLNILQITCGQLLDGLAQGQGEKYIISGCVNNGGIVSDGWLIIGGEFIPLVGGNALAYIKIDTFVTKEQFDDNTLKDTYTIKRAKFTSIAAGAFPFTDLKTLPFVSAGVYGNIRNLHTMISSILNFESEIILSGCLLSNVDTGANTLDISSGNVLFNNKLIASPAYSGAYPCYLTENGTYTNAEPGAGLYITFDPYTSQRYVDVLKRAMTSDGEIKMFETLSDRFDIPSGVGKWEMKGFQLMTSLQSRVGVGLWFDGNAVDNVTDALHTAAGNQDGENKHQLTKPEMPKHNAEFNDKNHLNDGDYSNDGDWFYANPGDGLQQGVAKSKEMGGDTPHNNMQPFTIIVYAKRVA